MDLNKNKEIVLFEDIVQEIVEETELPYEIVEEICRLNIDYVKHLTNQEDTLTILLPELGNLYYSERLGEFYKKRVSSYEGNESKERRFKFLDHKTKLIEQGEKENNVDKSIHRRKPSLYRFKNVYKKLYNGKIVKSGATLGFRELWSKFSEIQNKIQNGEKDYL